MILSTIWFLLIHFMKWNNVKLLFLEKVYDFIYKIDEIL